MVILTKNTLAQTLPTFIADVLRHNLTDKQTPNRSNSEWILENYEDEAHIKGGFPRIYVDLEEHKRSAVTPIKIGPVSITIKIEVWCSGENAKRYRNELVDEILQYLTDHSSSDGSSTMREQSVSFVSCTGKNDDIIIENTLIRLHRMFIEFTYYGH